MSKNDELTFARYQQFNPQGYTYFAFISYKRQDVKWAVWLKKKLQSYRLPAKTVQKHSNLPKRISPIFLDKDNMKPGDLSSQEREEVQAAKYLIVICSRNACRNSKNIDDEIQFFLDGGADPSRIIPLIVDDAKDPVAECYPLRLQSLCKRMNIIGANVHDSGKNNALLKIVAYMLGIKLEELKSEQKRRKKKQIWIRSVIAALLLIALSAVGWKCWDYYVPKEKYYLDYTEVYGLPQGIGELTKKETKSLDVHYTIVTRCGKIQELRFENSYGMITSASSLERVGRPLHIKYEYSGNGELSKMTYFDQYGYPVDKRTYNENHRTLDISDPYSSDYGSGQSLSAHTVWFFEDAGNAEKQKSNVVRYLIDYDENGYISEIRYARDSLNHVGTDADGISGIRYERDGLGRITCESFLSYTGEGDSAKDVSGFKVAGVRNGLASVKITYNNYDCVEVQFLDENDELTSGYYGASIIESVYDNHLCIEDMYFGKKTNLMLNDYGVASFKAEFNEHGNVVKQSCFGLKNEPVMCDDRYSSVETEYDEQGRITRQLYKDVNGSPVITVMGFASARQEYDDKGQCISISYFDEKDQLAESVEGHAIQKSEYDENGNEIKRSFYDAKGNPIKLVYGFACFEKEYDDHRNNTKITYYDDSGNITNTADGYAKIVRDFDEYGMVASVKYYDKSDQEVDMEKKNQDSSSEGFFKHVFG